ncbi:MAG TPA: HAMP domain-containing sensor histidine kinase [Acidimicrobiales bacterium]
MSPPGTVRAARWWPVAMIVGSAGLALVACELTLSPDAATRRDLLVLVGGLALGGVALFLALRRWVLHGRALRTALAAVVVASVASALVAVVVAARQMFLSSHDLGFLLAFLVFALGLGLALAFGLAEPLTADLRRVGQTATAVAGGDLRARTGLQRDDEIGAVAHSLDSLVTRLEELELARVRHERERQILLSSISHDLRTPLTAMRAAIEALEDGVTDDPRRYLASMHRDVDALDHLIDELFLHARLEAGAYQFTPSELDLAELADEAVEALTPLARPQQVRVELQADGPVRLRGGRVELSRVVRNLLDNAIRHSPSGGRVLVTVAASPTTAELTVQDDGPGFPPGFGSQAFDPFTRADAARTRASGSAGLGLAIARSFVTAHGGTIRIVTNGHGHVALTLPRQGNPASGDGLD